MTGDFPQFASSNYQSNAYFMNQTASYDSDLSVKRFQEALGKLQKKREEINQEVSPMSRRIVQVFIVDTNENIPLEKSLLYRGEQKLTDCNDQELYFEINVKELLDKHNLERVKTIDKESTKKSGKDIFLEPAKIRDLKMIVTNIATF